MRYVKKYIAVMSAVILMITTVPVRAAAAEANTPKEEIVYVNLNEDGSVREIHVVNAFDLDEDGTVTDYGEYETLRNMTTTDEIDYQDHEVTIDAGAGKLYYEGKLKDNEMPWTISVKYYMDGKEYSADQIAGMSGKLEIKMSIRQNKKCDSSFFEGYALQATVVLDTEKASDITADGASIANAGSDKQLTYTILPDSEKEIRISANVTDFEMDGISVNGIRMNMDIEIDDASLQEKIDKAVRAAQDLDEGTGELKEGVSEIDDATGQLQDAAGKIYSGAGSLYGGARELKKGLSSLTSKNSQITGAAWSAYKALCNAAQTQLNEQLQAFGFERVTLTPETYSDVLSGILQKLGVGAANPKLSAAAAQISALKEQLDDYGDFYNGLVEYTKGVKQAAEGSDELTGGLSDFYGSTESFQNAAGELHRAVGTLRDGTKELKEGTKEFADETSDLDTQVSDEIDSVTSSLTGEEAETVSFVSEKNTKIQSVQFVIQTEGIQKEEPEDEVDEEEETLSFWQKFLALFGIN